MKMLKIKDFAALSGLSVWAVRLLIAEGKIPAVRVGQSRGRIFVNAEQADSALLAMAAQGARPSVGSSVGLRRIEK